MINKQVLLDYANLKLQAKDIEAKIDFLQEEVLKQIREIQGDSDQPISLSEFPGCTFSIAARKTWKYTDRVVAAEKQLKELKAEEQATGAAEFTEEPQLRFNTPKS